MSAGCSGWEAAEVLNGEKTDISYVDVQLFNELAKILSRLPDRVCIWEVKVLNET